MPRASLTLLVLLLSVLAQAARADATVLWQLQLAGDQWPAAPAHSSEAHAVSITLPALHALQPQDNVLLPLPDASALLALQIRQLQEHVNGDLLIEAVGEDAVLTLTVGESWLFGQLESGAIIWQLQAGRSDDGAPMRAWLYRSGDDSDHHGDHSGHDDDAVDYLIPDPARRPALDPQPMIWRDAMGGEGSLLARSAVQGDGFELKQHFSEPAINVGEPQALALSVSIRNIGSSARRPAPLELFFVLEAMDLRQLPAGCQRRSNSASQPYLDCQLPQLAAGETLQLQLDLLAPAMTDAKRLWSTALLGNSLRHDLALNVVQDVLRGDPGNALSDFNVVLAEHTPRDPRGNVMIDVMALYTPQATARYQGQAETRVNQLIAVANQIYRDSGVGITLRPVLHRQVNYPATSDMTHMLEDITYQRHPVFDEVAQWREDFGADLVMLFHPLSEARGLCGMANLGGFNTRGDMYSFNDRDYAFSVISIDCPVSSVLAHEVGHNLGLTHSHRQDGQGGTLPWATGHGVDGEFVTVMADPVRFDDATRVARFSNPRLDCLGQPCGRQPGPDHSGADAAHVLNLVRFQVANYYPTRVPPLPSRMVASADGGATTTRIALAAATDGGRRFLQQVSPQDIIDIRAEFHIDERHIGREVVFHVLVETADGFLQLTEQGLVAGWNGAVSGLLPFSSTPQRLEHRAELPLVERYRPEQSLVGQWLDIYVAYRLLDSNELIYTAQPMSLDVMAAP